MASSTSGPQHARSRRRPPGTWLLPLALLATAAAFGGHPLSGTATLQQYQVYFGNLHSHTTFSDGSGEPAIAFAHARAAGLDFMAVTEHNHSAAESPKEQPARGGIASNPDLYEELKTAAAAATVPGTFVALHGQEFSTISSGNHVNVFGAHAVIDEEQVPSGDFKTLYEEWLPADTGVRFIQFNHPWDLKAEHRHKGYGFAAYRRSYGRLEEAVRPYVRSIEVINGPGLKRETGIRATVKGETFYRTYLTRGFRIGPAANQDNHHRNWGTLTDARTGVLSPTLTTTAIYQAIDERRFYATTDRNLRVWFDVNDAVMGSAITADSRTLTITWRVEDADEPDARYDIAIVHGGPNVSGSAVEEKLESRTGDHTGRLEWRTRRNRLFLYLSVTQWPRTASVKDRVVTAPVWVEIAR